MVYKDGVSNMHTQDFSKKTYKAFMENHQFWFVEKKMVIHFTKLTTKYPQRFNINSTFILLQCMKDPLVEILPNKETNC
jgi:hypothetical protein